MRDFAFFGQTGGGALAVGFFACCALAAAPGIKDFSQTVALSPGESLSLDTYKGSIHLTSWDRPEVQIAATIEAPPEVSAEYADLSVEATRVEVRQHGRGVFIKSDYSDVPYERSWLFGGSKTLPLIHYEIRAPRSLRLEVDDYKSEIEAIGFEGRILIETYKGRIDGRDLSGDIRIETYKGEARLYALRGRIDVDTYKGNVEARFVSLDENSSFDTYKGRITLEIPEGQGASLSANLGKRADFRSDFDLSRSRHGSRFQGPINGGGPTIHVKSHKGDIRIVRK